MTRESLNTFVVASSFSPATFDHGQRESNYWRYATAAINASGLQALEKSKTICNPPGERALVKSTEISSSEKSRIDEVILKLIASNDNSDENTMEQRGSSAENITGKSEILNVTQELEHAENIEINNISSGLQIGTSCSISSQSCYLSASELNFPNESFSIFNSSLDSDLEAAYKKQRISIALEDANETDIVDRVCTSIHLKDNQNDECRCTDVDDDSQQEYHSAEEQDYMDQNFTSKKETDSSDFFQVKEQANENGHAEDVFSTLACSSVVDTSNEIPESSQMYKCDQHYANDSSLNFEDHKREQSVSMFYSIHNEDSFSSEAGERSDSKPFLTCMTGIDEKVQTVSLSDVAISNISTINTGLCKKADHSSINVLQKSRNVQVLSQERTDLPYGHVSTEDAEVTDFCVYDQPIASIVTAGKDNCIPHLNNVASKNKVNQAVDASSDFRACFTTSRATNVKALVVSRSQNTMITMMNKDRPNEWLSVLHRSVACNTDWSFMYSNVEMTASPKAVADTLEKSVGCCTAKNGRNSKLEDCVKLNSRGSDEIPNRMVQFSQTTNLPCCCKELLQRAIKAEMQLLNIHCQKDHQHSWKTCKLDLEGKEYVSSSTLETRRTVMQGSLPQDIQAPSQDAGTSSLPVVIQRMSGDENSAPQPSPSSKEEKNALVENSSLSIQEVNEDWFDAKENLTGVESSITLTGNERKKDQLFGTAETQIAKETKKESKTTKKESNNFYCVHVAGLSPTVSEVDLWLRFQKYHVSKVSICEYSSNYRYATLGFKAASDAKLAVKEMNEQEIKGKAVKVQLVKSIREITVSNNHSFVKQDNESQRPYYSPEKNIENTNCNGILKVSPVSVTSKSHASDSISPSKGLDPSRDSLKSLHPVSALPNITRLAPASSESLCSLASSKNPSPDFKSSKTSSRNAHLETDQEDIAENLMPPISIQSSPHLSSTFRPPNALNLKSFRKVVKKLEGLHPETSRDNILDALLDIKENKGSLSGVPISDIVQMASSLLNKKYASKSEEKSVTHLRNK
ncbi:RNA-binding protein 44 [Tiliqua scincoides]|uniref:RNA-binding protein 44 n=1 Tax=Tiliqua scincoides TaxID=71010 RepID=UPI00346313AA